MYLKIQNLVILVCLYMVCRNIMNKRVVTSIEYINHGRIYSHTASHKNAVKNDIETG